MSVLYLEYPKCSTCQKAKKWLETNNITFEQRDIVRSEERRVGKECRL